MKRLRHAIHPANIEIPPPCNLAGTQARGKIDFLGIGAAEEQPAITIYAFILRYPNTNALSAAENFSLERGVFFRGVCATLHAEFLSALLAHPPASPKAACNI